jgi:hypothetical protein
MALTFRFTKTRERDCAWINDRALLDVPPAVRADWEKDFAASHLKPYAKNGELSIIKIRDLTTAEVEYVKRHLVGVVLEHLLYRDCFILAARFEGAPDEQRMPDGTMVQTLERKGDFIVLSEAFMKGLNEENPGLSRTLGEAIFHLSFPTATEKKASSPPSTEKPSSAAEGISPSTEGVASEPAA